MKWRRQAGHCWRHKCRCALGRQNPMSEEKPLRNCHPWRTYARAETPLRNRSLWKIHTKAGTPLRDCNCGWPMPEQGHAWGTVAYRWPKQRQEHPEGQWPMEDACWGRDTSEIVTHMQPLLGYGDPWGTMTCEWSMLGQVHSPGTTVHEWPTLGLGHPEGAWAVDNPCWSRNTPEGLWPLVEPMPGHRKWVRRKEQQKKRLSNKGWQRETVAVSSRPCAAYCLIHGTGGAGHQEGWRKGAGLKPSLGVEEKRCFPTCWIVYAFFASQYPNQ